MELRQGILGSAWVGEQRNVLSGAGKVLPRRRKRTAKAGSEDELLVIFGRE